MNDRQASKRASDALRIAARKVADLCIKCGNPAEDRISEKTGRKGLRCKRCRIRQRASMRKLRKRKTVAKEKVAAIVRLAAAHIERRRIQQARLDHGLPYSLSNTPILPKDLPPKRFEI